MSTSEFARGAEAKTAARNSFIAPRTGEALEEMRDALRRNAGSGVPDRELDAAVVRHGRNADAAAALVVLDRILEQVLRDHPNVDAIGVNRQMGRDVFFDSKVEGVRERDGVVEHAFEHLTQIELFPVKIEPAGIGAGKEQQGIGDRVELVNAMEQALGGGLGTRAAFGIGEDFLDAGA